MHIALQGKALVMVTAMHWHVRSALSNTTGYSLDFGQKCFCCFNNAWKNTAPCYAYDAGVDYNNYIGDELVA